MRGRTFGPVLGALFLVACAAEESSPPTVSNPEATAPPVMPPAAETTTAPDVTGPRPGITSAATTTTATQTPAPTTVAPSQTTSTALPTTPTSTIEEFAVARGDEGAQVERVQQELVRHGFALDTDGRFGPATEGAVRGFQYSHRLEVDGIVGPSTWAALSSAAASSTVILRDHGLAVADFGDPAAAVMPTLLEVLGTPEWDLTEKRTRECDGGLCEARERTVRWWGPDEAAFSVRFEESNGIFELVAWQLSGWGGRRGVSLATPEGVALGSTASELLAVYPNADFGHVPEPGCGDAWWNPGEFHIDASEADGTRGLRGSIDHDWDAMLQTLDEALIAHGISQGLDCYHDVMCAGVFGEFQQSVGLEVGCGLERQTWLALGLPLPPDPDAPVQLLRAGQNVTEC